MSTLTLEQAQRAVLEATKECLCCTGTGEENRTGYFYGCKTCGGKGSRAMETLVVGTGRVLLFPKAGERCPGHPGAGVIAETDVEGKVVMPGDSTWRFGHDKLCCGDSEVLPTSDEGRLLDAGHEAGYKAIDVDQDESRVTVVLRHSLGKGPAATGKGASILEALWRALYTTLDKEQKP